MVREIGSGDLMQGLVAFALLNAGVEHLERTPALSARYASLDNPPPDEERRPIPITTLARSMGLPRETVRRKVYNLVDQGMATVVDDGALVTNAQLARVAGPEYVMSRLPIRLSLFERLGYPLSKASEGRVAYIDEQLVVSRIRQLLRLLNIFYSRVYEPVPEYGEGDLKQGMVLMAMQWSIFSDVSGVDFTDPETLRPLAETPVAKADIAREIFLNRETLRRVIFKLTDNGSLRKKGGDLFLTPAFLESRALSQSVQRTLLALTQMLKSLAASGILVDHSPQAGLARHSGL